MPSTGHDEHQPVTVTALTRLPEPGPTAPQVLLVRNDADSADTVRHLAALGGPAQRRAVLRPTPGTADRAVLGLDLLVALGKNPEMLRQERQLTGELWPLAEAWLAALDIADLVLDRAHTLPDDMVLSLTALAGRVPADQAVAGLEQPAGFHQPAHPADRGRAPAGQRAGG